MQKFSMSDVILSNLHLLVEDALKATKFDHTIKRFKIMTS